MSPLDRLATLSGRSAEVARAALFAGPKPSDLARMYEAPDRARRFGEQAAATVRLVGGQCSTQELTSAGVLLVATQLWLASDEPEPLADHEVALCLRCIQRDVSLAYWLDRDPKRAVLIERISLEAVRGLDGEDDMLTALYAGGVDSGRRVGELAARLVITALDSLGERLPMSALQVAAAEVGHWINDAISAVLPGLTMVERSSMQVAIAAELKRQTRRGFTH